MTDSVLYHSRDGIAFITLNRPARRNAIDEDMAGRLETAWQRFEDGADVVAILGGADGNFSSGVDMKDPPRSGSRWAPNLGVRVTKPIIAAVEGYCIAGGMILLQQADLAVTSATAVFSYPESRIGFSKGVASALAARVPHKLAMEMLLLAQTHSAADLHRAGLVNAMVAPGGTADAALAWARTLAANDPDCMRLIKQGVLDMLPKAPGEIAAQLRWASDRLRGNRRIGDPDAAKKDRTA
ncbi:enoyl-CoA hydratase/isomerase family protein [Sphingomonas sp.]|uniref:enoyl-CoA hydratase/isomerase family protein n=1 Tax=Sphingomonas sp. TaxID=28214 RepID=UPI002DD69CC6|nr:enoyl-CoA hydratase/isomerase family protein [Sphingomonas sp.]